MARRRCEGNSVEARCTVAVLAEQGGRSLTRGFIRDRGLSYVQTSDAIRTARTQKFASNEARLEWEERIAGHWLGN
jgi:hypothetical protein